MESSNLPNPAGIQMVSKVTKRWDRPYIISWNLTYRCNLACEHCYLDAGPKIFQKVKTKSFQDRSELTTEQCFSIVDQIKEFAPEAITILTGGEPLLRRDILEIIRYAKKNELWTVVGTNGVLITENLARVLKEAGVRGMALSLDALDPQKHDQFRRVKGAWSNTVKGSKILHEAEMPFIVQTTVGKHNINEIAQIADFAFEQMRAKVFNLYFLVPSGRGQFVSDISSEQYNEVLKTLTIIQKKYDKKMLVNAKCAPHYIRALYETDPHSKFLKNFTQNAGGCPAGVQYMGIRPNGDMTPCPYLPVFAGNLKSGKLKDIWQSSELFQKIRKRNTLKDRCGACEFNEKCGGCRARAYSVDGDVMGQDPLCDYSPGKFEKTSIKFTSGMQYGLPYQPLSGSIEWDHLALERMKDIPAFVRGMVKKSVESYCEKKGISRVTVEELATLRQRMSSRIFGKQQ